MDYKKGLTKKEAEKKIKDFGYNEIEDIGKISSFKILLRQIKNNFVIYLLLVGMIISFFVGKLVTAYTILAVIIIVIFTGFFQEYKAEKAINALKKMIMPISIIIRNGKEIEIPSRELVPGDIVILRTGERVPADSIILESKDLLLNESILTGESQEVKKTALKNPDKFERENQVFMGTFIISGRCVVKVLNTGMRTEFGKIAGLITTIEKELPLQKKVNEIARYLVYFALSVSIFTGIIMILRNLPFTNELLVETLIVVIALSVAAFPEGFPVVLISTLASGTYKMAKKNAIVNRMSIIETLGETTVICSDKTGTITKGEMTVKKIYCDNSLYEVDGTGYEASGNITFMGKIVDSKKDLTLNLLLKSAVLCNDSKIERKGTDKEYNIRGTPTEGALLILGAKAGVFNDDLNCIRKEDIPFSSERKVMSVLCKEKSENNIYSKGALEILLKKCSYIQRGDGVFRILDKDRAKIIEINKKMASKSLRTLGFAYSKSSKVDNKIEENDLTFIGLVGMEDAPRDEVKEAVELCKIAGIKVKMITGDNKDTALSIAKEIGLDNGEVITGDELDALSDKALVKTVRNAVIFARVRPEHKLRIVHALKENGEIVTMTGDGVNDAPALKEAHIGVAMGIGGTDVTKEVADLTLKDDNFATIVEAVKEGRTIFSNIQKFTTYQISINFSQILLITLAIIIGLPLPLIAIQILLMNLFSDEIMAIALSFNPPSLDSMKKGPRRNSNILQKNHWIIILIAGSFMCLVSLGVFYFILNVMHESLQVARTTTLATMIFFTIANAYNFRSFRKGVFNRSPFTNMYLVYTSIISIATTLILIYTPLGKIFDIVPLSSKYLLIAFLAASSIAFTFDLIKAKKGDLNF